MKRLSLGFLGLASPLLLLALLLGGAWMTWLFATLSMLVPVALIALGAARPGAGAPPWRALLALAMLLEAGAIGLPLLAGNPARIAGLPPATLWMLVLLGLAPLVLVASAFALDFDRFSGRNEDRS